MNNLISFDGLSDVANNLIDKISSAAGWVATRETSTKIAVDTYIKDIQNSNYDPLTKAALISQSKKIIKEYCNQCNIVNRAIGMISSTSQPNNIDSDWLAQFMDKARLVHDEEFQVFWSRLLAEECNAPGSVPRALLHVMEQMDKSMANAFMAIASVSISFFDDGELEYTPIVLRDKLKDYYEQNGITLDLLIDLQAIGLIEISDPLSTFSKGVSQTPIIINYYDEQYKFPNDIKKFFVGDVVYTRIGKALCKAVSPTKIEGFFEYICIPLWE